MTTHPGKIEATVGNTFGLRTWVEYGFKHRKDDLGWADYRVTDSASSERWWELVMSAYTLVSLQTADSAALGHVATPPPPPIAAETPASDAAEVGDAASLEAHPAWDTRTGWKHHLNNLRLLLPPYVCTCLLLPWLHVVPLPHVQAVQTGLAALGSLINTFRLVLPTGQKSNCDGGYRPLAGSGGLSLPGGLLFAHGVHTGQQLVQRMQATRATCFTVPAARRRS
jgi:hypothetical protein